MTDSQKDTGIDQAIEAITEGIADLAVPLPKAVKLSLWKALSSLIAGIAEVPGAWLHAKAQAIQDDTEARSLVSRHAAAIAAKGLSEDPALARRATLHLSSRVLAYQRNREAVAHGAMEDLKLSPPNQDSTDIIDEDWLEIFSRIAEVRSNVEMQTYLSKLLAGEIRKPGTFSPSTIQVLATMTPALGQLFQSLCCISIAWPNISGMLPHVQCAPFGAPADNALAPLGFDYVALTSLQDAGLLQASLESEWKLTADVFSQEIDVGGLKITPVLGEGYKPDVERNTQVLLFTQAGRELRGLVHTSANRDYVRKFRKWLHDAYKLDFSVDEYA